MLINATKTAGPTPRRIVAESSSSSPTDDFHDDNSYQRPRPSTTVTMTKDHRKTSSALAIIILQPRMYHELDLTLNKLVTEYKARYHEAMQGFSRMLEHALAVEERMGLLRVVNERNGEDRDFMQLESSSSSSSMLLSASIQRRIHRTIECVEHDEQVLKRLLSLSSTSNDEDTLLVEEDDRNDDNDSDEKSRTPNKRNWVSIPRSIYMALPHAEYTGVSLNPARDNEKDDDKAFLPTSGTTMNGTDNMHLNYKNNNDNNNNNNDDVFGDNQENEHSYESAIQILAHLVGDWTQEGRSVRSSLYGWICSQILNHSSSLYDSYDDDDDDDDEDYIGTDTTLTRTLTVLVPGSGMGRLAYDISRLHLHQQKPNKNQPSQRHRPPISYEYSVEANELSISMTVAASSIISNVLRHIHQRQQTQHGTDRSLSQTTLSIHPYVMDNLANEINVERRYDKVHFPDVVQNSSPGEEEGDDGDENICGDGDEGGSISFTLGDFGSRYYTRERWGQYDFIVTAFFLDTAHNAYEYIETIKNLLRKRKGIWINVGPVQWHQKSVFRPSVDELRNIIEHVYAFKILHWAVDDDPISYRDGGEISRYTNYDGYRPLRFVASVC